LRKLDPPLKHSALIPAQAGIQFFGTPVDVTLSELAIESSFPADAAAAEGLRGVG